MIHDVRPGLAAFVLGSLILMAPEARGDGSPPWPGPLRAVHVGGYWGTNKTEATRTLPADFFTYLRRLQVDTVGISVSLFVDSVTDSNVKRVYKQGEPDPGDSIYNTGNSPAVGVGVSLAESSAFIPWRLAYQTTDPGTNVLSGTPYTLADIPSGQGQTYVIALTPSAPFDPSDVAFKFEGANTAPAPVVTGLDTLWLSSSATAVPDILALGATPTTNGIVDIPGAAGAAAFAVATVNVGTGARIKATADTGPATLPIGLTICQTNPVTSACLSPPGLTATTQINSGETPTFAIFVAGHGTVPFDPSGNRIFVRFRDDVGIIRGATSVAVRTR
jgi:hypothetical protein